MRLFPNLLGALGVTLSACAAGLANNAPQITNVQVVRGVREVTVTYDLSDDEDANLNVSVKVRDSKGNWIAMTRLCQGDVGFPVAPGKQRRLLLGTLQPADIRQIELVADDRSRIDVEEIVKNVSVDSLRYFLQRVEGVRDQSKKGKEHVEEVRNFIGKKLGQYTQSFHLNDTVVSRRGAFQGISQAMGWKMPRELVRKNPTYDLKNLIGEKPGDTPGGPSYILCAHYDAAQDSPGADDNASGIAGLLEAARVMSKLKFANTVRFIGLDLEEEGLLGSWFYALKARQRGDSIGAVINFDMIGMYSDKENSQLIPEGFEAVFPAVVEGIIKDGRKGNFVVNTSNQQSRDVSEQFVRNAGRHASGLKVVSLEAYNNGEYTNNLAQSDHTPFWLLGYKALHIGDGGETRNMALNTKADHIDLVNYEFMARIVKATVATLCEQLVLRQSSSVVVDVK